MMEFPYAMQACYLLRGAYTVALGALVEAVDEADNVPSKLPCLFFTTVTIAACLFKQIWLTAVIIEAACYYRLSAVGDNYSSYLHLCHRQLLWFYRSRFSSVNDRKIALMKAHVTVPDVLSVNNK